MENHRSCIIFLLIFTLVYGKRVSNLCDSLGQISCDNGQCISKVFWCDKEFDCFDKSDEKYCESRRDIFEQNESNFDEKEHGYSTTTTTPFQTTTTTRIYYERHINEFLRNVRKVNYSHFYFTKNYTEDFAYEYKSAIEKAKNWLLAQKDDSYSWGRDTPSALIALSLISNSFKVDVEDNSLMFKSLHAHLETKIFRNETGIEKVSTPRLAMYINALLATCQDPRDFLGIDLVDILRYTENHMEQNQRFINPLIYISLCLTDINITKGILEKYLLESFPNEISKDNHILAMTALACVAQKSPNDSYIRTLLNEAAEGLLSQLNPNDGSFGSIYSTALAAQALMSLNTMLDWEPRETLNYLVSQQQKDGSFGDMSSTYYALLALSGRSLLHLRNTRCDSVINKNETFDYILNGEESKKNVLYTLRVGHPEMFSTGMKLSVLRNATFFDIMRVAAYKDSRFKFEFEIGQGKSFNVHTIANISNNLERGMSWTLYLLNSTHPTVDVSQRYLGSIIDLVPNDGDELIFWYLSNI